MAIKDMKAYDSASYTLVVKNKKNENYIDEVDERVKKFKKDLVNFITSKTTEELSNIFDEIEKFYNEEMKGSGLPIDEIEGFDIFLFLDLFDYIKKNEDVPLIFFAGKEDGKSAFFAYNSEQEFAWLPTVINSTLIELAGTEEEEPFFLKQRKYKPESKIEEFFNFHNEMQEVGI